MRYGLCLGVVVIATVAGITAASPDPNFVAFSGKMYGEANQGQPAHHSHQQLVVTVPPGMVIDTSYNMGNLHCCGGDENGNASSITVPSGIKVQFGGGNAGEWGIFNISRDSITDDDTGQLKGYNLYADLYCGPSATKGGCNVNLQAWVALKPIKPPKPSHR
jgi:hypothetical protein